MIKPRLVPILLTAAITASVLFGGWAIYNQVAVAAPIGKVVAHINGVVSSSKPVMTRDQVTLDLVLKPEANIREIYQEIAQNGKDVFGDRKLAINIQTNSDTQLEEFWSESLFRVAEAMETKAYSDIPHAMKDAAKTHANVTVTTDMDDTNVYITMKNADAVKYVVLPRTPSQLEAW
ncbi:hypothetical protein [Paenibacillus sp. sgz302251]|uniref:hypothetical protein n=1 Tax=Paenibacillus sp. sgz302251 TaxID=3414493 RepID=UPI003C7DEE2B